MALCSSQVISDSWIDFFDVDSRSKALGDKFPNLECKSRAVVKADNVVSHISHGSCVVAHRGHDRFSMDLAPDNTGFFARDSQAESKMSRPITVP